MKRLAFKVQYKKCTLAVDITERGAEYALEAGDRMTIVHNGETLSLRRAHMLQRPLQP